MKVKAIRLGYYQHKRRREGEVFELESVKNKDGEIITPEEQFSDKWMVKVGKKVQAEDDEIVEAKPSSRKPKSE